MRSIYFHPSSQHSLNAGVIVIDHDARSSPLTDVALRVTVVVPLITMPCCANPGCSADIVNVMSSRPSDLKAQARPHG
jgi:hypothetical protein